MGTGVGFSMIILTASLFIEPLQAEYGITRSQATIIPLVSLLALPMHMITGSIVDRIGARPVGCLGISLLVVLLIAMTQVTVGSVPFYGVLLALAIIGPMTSATVFTQPIALWFADRPGMAFSITMTGVSVIGALAIPLVSSIIALHGWRWGYVALAAIVLLLGCPAIFRWFFAPAGRDEMPVADAEPPQSLRTLAGDRRLWLLVGSLGLAAIPIGGFMGHMQPLLTAGGFDMADAARAGALFALSIGMGRLAAGFLLDRFPAGAVAGGCLALASAGAFLFGIFGGSGNIALLTLAVVLIAFAYGAEADFVGYFCLRMFGSRNYALLFGLASTFIVVGIGAGGLFFAAAHDLFGSYFGASHAGAGMFLLSAIMLSSLGRAHLRTA